MEVMAGRQGRRRARQEEGKEGGGIKGHSRSPTRGDLDSTTIVGTMKTPSCIHGSSSTMKPPPTLEEVGGGWRSSE